MPATKVEFYTSTKTHKVQAHTDAQHHSTHEDSTNLKFCPKISNSVYFQVLSSNSRSLKVKVN